MPLPDPHNNHLRRAVKPRPSLIAPRGGEDADDAQHSILELLDDAPARAGRTPRARTAGGRARRPWLSVFLFALAFAGLAAALAATASNWNQWNRRSLAQPPALVVADSAPANTAAGAAPAAMPTPPVEPARTEGLPAAAPTGAAAAIEELPAPASATASEPAAVPADVAPPQATSVSQGQESAAAGVPVMPVAPVAATPKSAPAKASGATVAKRPAAPADKARRAAHAEEAAHARARKAATEERRTTAAQRAPLSSPGRAGAPDGDVEIVSALMATLDGPGPSGEGRRASTAPGRSIAELVQACRRKPEGEAQACRRRICEGYWGKADACPARGNL